MQARILQNHKTLDKGTDYESTSRIRILRRLRRTAVKLRVNPKDRIKACGAPAKSEVEVIFDFQKEIPFPAPTTPKFKFIDLFAGIGGMRIPFENAGAKCVFSSEIDKFARETYAANFGEEPFGDITQILAEEIPEFDILLAGFPCQPFSLAGVPK